MTKGRVEKYVHRGRRGKLSKKFECSVNIGALVIDGYLDFSYEEGFDDG